MVPPCHARLPSLFCSYLAMARKANSTFMPVLALVSMKGTPYSCQEENVLRASLWLLPPLVLPTGSHLPWPVSLHPLNGSLFHCSHPPVKPRWVTLGKETSTPAGPSPAWAGPSLAAGAATACPLLVACGTAGGMIGLEPGFLPCSGCVTQLPARESHCHLGRWETLFCRGVVTSLRDVTVVGTNPCWF